MSDLAQCSAKLHSVVSKHLHCLLEVDIESLKFHIQQKELLDIGESDQVWDTTRPCRERMKQLIHFACRKVNYHNGLHRFETFIRCLVESGHRDLSDALTADLNVQPEETVNEDVYRVRRQKEFSELFISIVKKLCIILQATTKFEEFKVFVCGYTTHEQHKLDVLNATAADAVFKQLLAGDYVSDSNTGLLYYLLLAYGDESVTADRDGLKQFDRRKMFVEFSLEVAHRVSERTTTAQLKVCTLNTPVQFGRYYKMLENVAEVSVMIKILRDWEHPELLHRVVRNFYREGLSWLNRYQQEQSKSLSEESDRHQESDRQQKEYLTYLECYADLLVHICRFLETHAQNTADFLRHITSFSLCKSHTSFKLITGPHNTVYDTLLTLLPFSSFTNTYLIQYIVNNFCDDTLQEQLCSYLQGSDYYTAHTYIHDIYNTQLDCLPLQLTERNVVVFTLHLKGERWRNPLIKHANDLAFSTAETFDLQPWCVVYYRTILTGNEPGKKGDCKIEMLVPAMAACILLKEAEHKQSYFHEHSITYLELHVDNDCYLSSTPCSVAHIHQRALKQSYFSPYLEKLNNFHV